MLPRRAAAVRVWAILLASLSAITLSAQAPRPAGGRNRVIVEMRLASPHVGEGRLTNLAARAAQRREIAEAGTRIAGRLNAADHRVIRRYQTVPYLAIEAAPAALAALRAAPDVVRVFDDEIVHAVLSQSVPQIQADQAWASGYDGSGTTIAILDTGVDAQHPFLAGKVVDEACFSSTVAAVSQSTCPNGSDQQLGPGAGAPCSLSDCLHGTHVAGIAAGRGPVAGAPFSGVARGANLLAIQVFSRIIDPASCGGGVAPCAGAFSSDIIAGLEYAYTIAGPLNLAAVNLSLGGSSFPAPCDDQPYKPAIDNLRSIGVASVIASGNEGNGTAIASPACVSSAVSVGAVGRENLVSYFSNAASFLSLYAPGESIVSSVPGGTFAALSGTSMAAPHVAGAWAIAHQAAPAASVAQILNAFRATGRPITDTRIFFGGGTTVPRISVFEALASLVPVTHPIPTLTSTVPSRLRAGTAPVTVTLVGSGFDAFSVASWNGAARPTSVISTTQLTVGISAADLAASGPTAQLRVTAPAPGGGTSAPLTVTIDPPPSLSVSATSVGPSSKVTATLANGFGGPSDWLGLASSASGNTSYITFTYVGTGVTDRTWTVTLPSTPGPYEFRLFPNNSYTRAATSPVVTVDAAVNPAPAIGSLSPASTPAGSGALTLTVNGTGFVASSIVQWNGDARPTTFVSATQLRAAIGTADLAATGTTPVTVVTQAPGGGASAPAIFTAGPPIGLAASSTTVAAGAAVTATLTGAPGGSGDWLALAATSAPNTSYLSFVYVGGGVTSRTWTVNMPSTPGTYEFRLFLNNGYTKVAASPAITVSAAMNPAPGVTTISPASLSAGGAAFTLTVNGSGFTAASEVRWDGAARSTTFVSGTQLRASIGAADVAAVRTAQVTVFSPSPGGGTSAALPFTVTPPPVLTVSATSAAAGTTVTVTLTNSPGGLSDWLALALTSAANTSYYTFTYVGNTVTTRTWTVTMPQTPGTYEFRLFLNNGYTRVATSLPVTVVRP